MVLFSNSCRGEFRGTLEEQLFVLAPHIFELESNDRERLNEATQWRIFNMISPCSH